MSSMWKKRAWVIFGLILAVGVSGFGPASPAGAEAQRTHELTGRSQFTAETTSKTLVRFPRQVTPRQLHVSWEGDGRISGFIMRKLGTYEQEGYRPVMEGVSVGRCKKRGCEAKSDSFRFTVCFCGRDDLEGTWELAVVADGAPVTVTIKIKDEDGSDHVRVVERVTSEIKTLEPRVDDGVSHSLVSAGDYTELDQVDFGVVGLWVSGDPHAATAIGDCNYYDYSGFGYPSVLPPEEVAFLPGCPAASGSVFPVVDPDGGTGGAFLTSAGFGAQVGLGGWYQTASLVKDYGATAFWIDF